MQRFLQALQPKGDARVEWEFLHELVFNVTGQNGFVSIEGLFNQMAKEVPAFNTVTWASLGVSWPFLNRVATETEASVAPGQNATFTFQVKAPPAIGVYSIHLRPVIDGTTWMEDEGVFLIITVVP